MAASNPHIAK